MAAIDPRIDDYIFKSAPFAKPILHHLRNVIHTACLNVKETIKWSFPNFEYAGAILCSMAAFKQHCTFGFWLGSLMPDPDKILQVSGEKTAMGGLGPLKSIDDLPAENVLIGYIKEAMLLNEKGVKAKKEKASSLKEMATPAFWSEALEQHPTALAAYEKLSPSHKKEYVEWFTEAKTEATRSKRMATALEWLAAGKTRNWKYTNG